MKPLEKDIERAVCNEARARGILAYKFSAPGNRGVPDRIFIYQGRIAFVEFKRPGGKVTRLQEVHIKEIQKQGFQCVVIDNRAAGIALLDSLVSAP